MNENDLISEALSALIGIEGRYISLGSGDSFSVRSDCAIADYLHSQFLRILEIGTFYIKLQHTTQRSSSDFIIQVQPAQSWVTQTCVFFQ